MQLWYLVTRVHGRQRRIKIGTYPILTLVDARDKARGILREKELGRLVEKDGTLTAKRKPTLPEIIPEFIRLYAKPRNRAWGEAQALLGKFSVLGNRPIDEIRRPDVVAVLDSIVAKGTPCGTDRRVLAFPRWCYPLWTNLVHRPGGEQRADQIACGRIAHFWCNRTFKH